MVDVVKLGIFLGNFLLSRIYLGLYWVISMIYYRLKKRKVTMIGPTSLSRDSVMLLVTQGLLMYIQKGTFTLGLRVLELLGLLRRGSIEHLLPRIGRICSLTLC